MTAIFSLLSTLGLGSGGGVSYTDDDAIDRLSRKATIMLLMLSIIIVSTKQYVGDPIQCWVPGHFPKHYADYVNKLCWVSNTYYLPLTEPVPMSTPDKQLINYYQWVPMLLLFHAVLFYLPCLMWKNLSKTSGINLHDLLETSKHLRDFEKREKVLRHIAHMIDHFLRYYQNEQHTCCAKMKKVAKKCCLMCGKRHGNYLGLVYIFIKFLYLANAVGHMFLLGTYLGTDFHMLGIRVMKAFINSEESPVVYIFPRETFCDFKIRTQGSTHRYSVQCVLPINFFNEKIYVCIWFWFVLVIVATVINIVLTFFELVCVSRHVTLVRNYLQCSNMNRSRNMTTEHVQRFVHKYLRQDGVLLLRILRYNVSDLDIADLTGELWDKFQKHILPSPV